MSDPNPILDRSVDQLEVSVRTSMAIDKAGIQTVRELTACSRAQLKAFGFTDTSIREVAELLGDMGLSLAE